MGAVQRERPGLRGDPGRHRAPHTRSRRPISATRWPFSSRRRSGRPARTRSARRRPRSSALHVSGPTPLALPGIMGTALEGQKLSAASGIWRGVGAIGYGFQWYRCDTTGNACSSIQGSTSPTYTLVAKDVGETIGLTVRATDATGSVAAYSSLIGPIADGAALLSATAQPSISGTPRTGQALTVSNGGWTVTPRRYAYRWLRCNANGRLCAAIPAAAGAQLHGHRRRRGPCPGRRRRGAGRRPRAERAQHQHRCRDLIHPPGSIMVARWLRARHPWRRSLPSLPSAQSSS